MKLKIFKRYFLTTFLIIILSLAVMMMILSFVLNNYIANSRQQVLTNSCTEVADFIEDCKEDGSCDGDELTKIISKIANISEIEVFITDENRQVTICSCMEWQEDKTCMHSRSGISSRDIKLGQAVSSKGKKIFLSDLKIYDTPHYVAMKQINQPLYPEYNRVFATSSVSAVGKLLSTVVKFYLMAAILPIFLMFLAIYVINYKMIKPLKLMSEAAKAMAKGDYSRRIPVMSDDEIGELSTSFNMLSNSLSRSESMRKSFVANVSHELKTPMTTIGGFIDGILDGTIEPERQGYYLEIVSDEIKRLSRLVQSMLSMSKLESGEFILKPELFDLRELIFTVVISQERRIESENINIVGLDELPEISFKADKDLIHQVVFNLLDNAIKFTEKGGTISFSLKNENGQVNFVITNTGKGIPKNEISHIFERFYKVDKSRSASKNSMGLGLYIVKTIINAHSGKIAVSSKEGEVTSFKVVLPIESKK